ncbi:MAG: DUF1080 domain-containing protein [Planctomycetales bacterium]|nr:DUF1080 domain-containing protein [Planctomycetales bacterium]
MKIHVLTYVAVTIGLSACGLRADEFVSLFDGKSLKGWTQRNGTATYRIEGDTIVGKTSDGSPNSFLCTDKLYDNFELQFEVKVDDRLNSGVQIRSQTKDGPQGRVNGPQVEIEATGPDGSFSGYVYGEAAGGWMSPDDIRKAHKHFKNGEWNKYRVIANGANIKVWLNDHQISDLNDEAKLKSHPKGFIGLQVHGIGEGQGPYEVAWRNLKIKELPATKLDIAGTWNYVNGQSNGEAIGEDRLQGDITITADSLTLQGPDAKFVFEYKIDSSKKPNAIHMIITESPFGTGAEANGIVRRTGEQLELCYAMEGDAPEKFEAGENSGHRYLVLEKKK